MERRETRLQDLVILEDLSPEEIRRLLNLAADLKKEWKGGGNKPVRAGLTVALIFQKPLANARFLRDGDVTFRGLRHVSLASGDPAG
jgi:ornithine carbamoyltransferase